MTFEINEYINLVYFQYFELGGQYRKVSIFVHYLCTMRFPVIYVRTSSILDYTNVLGFWEGVAKPCLHFVTHFGLLGIDTGGS